MGKIIETVIDGIPPGYITREEALARLGCSEATLDRMSRDGRIRSKLVPRSRLKPMRTYTDEDVDRLKREKETRRVLRPPSTEPKPTGVEVAVARAGFTADSLRELLETLISSQNERAERVNLHTLAWLTWEQASELSGIPELYVRGLADRGVIHAQKFGRSWRVLRTSLEAYEGEQGRNTKRASAG